MKNIAACSRKENLFYVPNGVTRREFFQKLLNGLLMAASGIGVGAMVLFFLAL